MRPTRPTARGVITVGTTIAAATLAAMLAAPAQAATSDARADVQQQVDQQITRYGGVQTGPGEVSYRAGTVKLLIGAAPADQTCASGWYCFYQYKDYGGRKLQFQDCGSTQYLTNYGFGNKTTSWKNASKHTIYTYNNATTPPTSLWTEEPNSASANVGDTLDNRADSFYTAC